MAPEDGHGRSHAAHATEYAVQMAGALARLDAIHSEVTRLADHVAAQNGRIGKVETRQAAYDAMAVTGVREHQGVDDRMDDMDVRVKGLETYRDEATGMGKASLGILSQILTIAALALAVWQFAAPRLAHEHAPTQQVQAK